MNQKKCTHKICRQQGDNSAGFFVDQSLHDFYIKSNGKVIKHFQGRVMTPRTTTPLELSSIGKVCLSFNSSYEKRLFNRIKVLELKVATPKR